MQTATAEMRNPADICAAIELAGGHKVCETHHNLVASQPKRKRASLCTQPIDRSPASVPNAADMLPTLPSAASGPTQPMDVAPHSEPWLSVDLLPHYQATAEMLAVITEIRGVHRLRQNVIRAKTGTINQMKAVLRSLLCTAADFEEDTASDKETAYGNKPRKLSDDARKRVEAALKSALAEIESGLPESIFANAILPYVEAQQSFERQNQIYEKVLAKLAKKLPVYQWAKSVKGLGDVSFATIVGECGDIGSYKSIAAVWKRLGLAVINGKRQGAPGQGASADEWIEHGYSPARRSVSWNARQQVIGGMGKWRPEMGEDVRAKPELTEYQKVYAERARYEAEKLGLPITESDKGRESYKQVVANRAHRYVEKRLIKHLYLAWRRASAA